MKNCLTLSFIALIITGFLSCKKDANAGITGKWQLVSDSTHTSGIGPNGTPGGGTYVGQATDSYDFMANGQLIAHVAGKVDSATYTVQPGNKLHINYSIVHEFDGAILKGASTDFDLSVQSSHKAVLTSDIITPGGTIARIVVLTK
ncbi:hypothetical protein [Mucilaginibacter dorajii]|uniref:Lipocalin-like domain-containing protein n=1 Tax=Mucilaginibacter dorajii TaxID=692994 RepID=A0ABP7Q3W6_9SPHI|nr:hypothetical protein [Mucilaginibacter dorajii]MCS3732701.1 hypothetical protein [Mucilaginibacter dorajii]